METKLIEALNEWIVATHLKTMLLADVHVWSSKQAAKMGTHSPGRWVTLVYEGAGHDCLNYNSGIQSMRDEVRAIAKACGFSMEDNNTWSCSFYPL